MSAGIVKSARRVFEVLELFERERRPLSLKDVCGALRLAPSSGAALLKSLVALGYLDYDRGTRSYFPTMRITFLGKWVEEALFGGGAILRLMQRLYRSTGETALLAAQSDLNAQYIHSVHGAEPLQAAVQPGSLRPLANSGMGWLLLSRQSEDAIERFCRRIDIAQGRRVDRIALKRNVAVVRADGYVFSRHTVRRGTGIIAMLLPEGRLGRTFALGIGGPVANLEKKQAQILDSLRRGIKRFSRI
ncbi:MAG: helix-turn-helix domain-containing protein [Alphaproteobacteria bacterium]|nr:helix-turn-helix domain-containing protein [Alphaproteobacteria bacterium]MBL6937252.1 helix-turn-helix domain-containing protein [Alphaproteobacteria bacterium]MBL7096186.1 helix-turn-helix domain-containing protein [Alphaproteobacteria bacterium]